MRLKVFLSHSSRDEQMVKNFQSQLRTLGCEVYVAASDPQPGRDLDEKILQAIKTCDMFIALITPNSISSPYVQQEIGAARSAGKLMVPIIYGDVPKDKLAMLERKEYIRYDPEHPEKLIENLAAFVNQIRDELVAKDVTTAFAWGGLCGFVVGALLTSFTSKQ